MSIKIGLFGFGRTGSVVAKVLADEPGISLEWVCRNSSSYNSQFASHTLGFTNEFAPFVSAELLNNSFLKTHPVDVAIDFSSGGSSKIYESLANAGIKIVSAISNYNVQELEFVKKASEKTAVLYSPNITLGINWLIMASKILKQIIPNADIEVVEEHFRAKKDVSGTALKLAHHLNINPKEHVNSIRVGGIVGKHEVIFGLPNQTIRLTHESINRTAFGTGAVFAAKWLYSKKSGLYSMEQLLHEKFSKKLKELEV